MKQHKAKLHESSQQAKKGETSQHRGLGGIVLSHSKQDDQMEEDERWEGVMGQQLEAMVEELAGEDSFFFNFCDDDNDDDEEVRNPTPSQERSGLWACGDEEMENALSQEGPQTGKNQQALLEDAMSKVESARDALSTVIASTVNEDVTLRGAAPEFVPGQLWQGSQRSCFVD